MAIHISFRGVVNSQPRVLETQDIFACLFSVKSGTDILHVVADIKAINLLKKGTLVSVQGVFSPKTAMVGATQVSSIDTQDKSSCIISGTTSVENIPQQTRRKPNKSGLYDVPKSASVVKGSKPATNSNAAIMSQNDDGKVSFKETTPIITSPERKKEPVVKTTKSPSQSNAKKPSSFADSDTSSGFIDGLPLPTSFGTQQKTFTTTPIVEPTIKENNKANFVSQTPADNGSQKKDRWSMDDFNM